MPLSAKRLRIFAGPWVGEFGWELFVWQGILRTIASNEKYRKFVVCGRKGHDYLYKDFATEYINYDPPTAETNMWMCEKWSWNYNGKYDVVIKPHNCLNYDQEFIKFGESGDHQYDIVIHARSTDKCGSAYRNWNRDNWDKFKESFPDANIASIGTMEGALSIGGTVDRRGIPLRELADVLANSTVLVGPSSGPIHFGSLCGLPHVTWSPKETTSITPNKERYERDWNPLKTPVTFLEGSWNPDVKDVVGAVRKYYGNT